MPESLDFDQIAQRLTDQVFETRTEGGIEYSDLRRNGEGVIMNRAWFAEQLRQVWNARGAADAHAVEERLATLTGWVSSEPYRQHLREAIEALNR